MPWCHDCGAEFEDGDTCPLCGSDLKDEYPPASKPQVKIGWSFKRSRDTSGEWPKDENGENIAAAFLTNIGGSQLDYDMALSMLRSFGIPYACEFPGGGQLAKIYLGYSAAGMDIYVPETMLEDARNIFLSDTEENE